MRKLLRLGSPAGVTYGTSPTAPDAYAPLSRFGDLVRKLRLERGLTMERLARKIGTHKGYICGIEGGKVSPPSVKVIKKYARALDQDETHLVRIAWVDNAPALIREDALRFLEWVEAGRPSGR